MPKTPSYRRRPGYTQAIVTLTDSVTKKRRDFWLGPHGTKESREQYHRVIAEWEANGRRFPRAVSGQTAPNKPAGLELVVLIRDFYRWATRNYDKGELRSFYIVMVLMRRYYGRTPAVEFGPRKLRMLREEMIRGDQTTDPPRKPWSRKYINQQVQRVRRIFKWAVAYELVAPDVHQALCTLEPLKRGRSGARENPKIGPAPQGLLDAVLPNLSRPVGAIVDLQLLTGARAGELLQLRRCDIEIDDKTGVWAFRPDKHKNMYREHERVIYFGPRAQRTLLKFMGDRSPMAYLFSPREAEAERRAVRSEQRQTPLSCGNRPGTNKNPEPEITPGDCYTTDSYRRAISYACDSAFPPPRPLARREDETVALWWKRLKEKKLLGELNAWRRSHRFNPHQLRHSAGTHIRRDFGLEAAQLALGHASASITDAVYAERDRGKVIEVMRSIG